MAAIFGGCVEMLLIVVLMGLAIASNLYGKLCQYFMDSIEEEYSERRTITQTWELLLEQDPKFKMVVDLAKPRGSRKNVMPLTRENVRLAFAAFEESIAEQLTELAIECFSHSHSPRFITTEDGDEFIETNEAEVYFKWGDYSALRICNQRLDGFLIEISDFGVITRFKYERPPFLYPRGWNYTPTLPAIPDDDLGMVFDNKNQSRFRRRFGNIGDKYDLYNKAWKRDS
jgi:hypothetical protein